MSKTIVPIVFVFLVAIVLLSNTIFRNNEIEEAVKDPEFGINDDKNKDDDNDDISKNEIIDEETQKT